MKKLIINKKVLTWSILATVAVAAIVIPVAVVYGSNNSSEPLKKTIKEDGKAIEVVYGTEVSKVVAPVITNYAPAKLDSAATTYTPTLNVGTANIKAVFLYEPDAAHSDLANKLVTYPITITKALIMASDVPATALTSQANFTRGSDPVVFIKPAKLAKYNDWQGPTYKNDAGDTLTVEQVKALTTTGSTFMVIYTAIPDSNHMANDVTLQTITHTKTVTLQFVATMSRDYKIDPNGSVPIETVPTEPGYGSWSSPVYSLDNEVGEVSEVTFIFRDSNRDDAKKFSFFSELYFYDASKAKIDYDVTEYTETKKDIVYGETINDWMVRNEDLPIVKKFLTDGEASPEKTKKELIDTNQIGADRLLYDVGGDGIDLWIKRPENNISQQFNRILLLNPYQTSISTQRLKVKFKTPTKLDTVSYYFASNISTNFSLSFKTASGTTFRVKNPTMLTKDGVDATTYRNDLANATQEAKDAAYSETIRLNDVDTHTIKVLPIDTGTIYYKVGDLALETLSDFNNLAPSTMFTATYKATKDPATTPAQELTYTVKYKVTAGDALPSPGNTTPEKRTFLSTSIYLPADKSGTSVRGYLPWELPVITSLSDPTVKYTSIIQLKSLEPQSKFKAVYVAKKDPRFNATEDAVYTVEYTFLNKPVSYPGNSTPETKGFSNISTSLPADKTGTPGAGYGNWSAPVFASKDNPNTKYTTVAELIALPLGAKFTGTYTAAKNPNYAVNQDAVYTIEYTVQGQAGTNPGGTGTAQVFLTNATALPADKTEQVTGWGPWSVKFKVGATEYTALSELKALTPGTVFIAEYTALKDPKYTSAQDAVYTVSYTVKAQGTPGADVVNTGQSYTYGSTVPSTKPARLTGYLDWTGPVYTLLGVTKTPAEIQALMPYEVFRETYTAQPDLNYIGITTPTHYSNEYTVAKVPAGVLATQTATAMYPHGGTTAPIGAHPIVVGYNNWTVVYTTLSGGLLDQTGITALAVNQKFKATWYGDLDATKYSGAVQISYEYTYTIV